MVRLLVAKGAAINERLPGGPTPLGLALGRYEKTKNDQYNRIAEYLKSNGAK